MTVAENSEKRLLICYGSHTGQSESIAKQIADRAALIGLQPFIFTLDQHEEFDLERESFVVIVISSTGDGDAPENCARFVRRISRRSLDNDFLSGLEYAILGLGDSNYSSYQGVPMKVDKQLSSLGARRVIERGVADDQVGLELAVEPWCEALFKHIAQRFQLDLSVLSNALQSKLSLSAAKSESEKQKIMDEWKASSRKLSVEEEAVTVLRSQVLPIVPYEYPHGSSVRSGASNLAGDANLRVPVAPLPFISIFISQERFMPSPDLLWQNGAAMPGLVSPKVVRGTVVSHSLLTSLDAKKPKRELILDLEGAKLSYEPGDAFYLVTENMREEVDFILERTGMLGVAEKECVLSLSAKTAKPVLETAYNDYANAQQRFDIISEFYGKEFVLFRTDKIRSLKQILEEEPGKKKLIVKHLEEIVLDVVQKTTLRHSLTHRLLLDCFSHCDKEQKSNLIDSLKDKLPELVHTNEGSQVAMRVVWNANAKERKLIIKNFKGLSVKAAMEQHGCRVLMSIFDSVDDTVLVNKYITQELANEIKKVVMDKFGVRVIHYLVHPRDGRVLDQDIIKQVKMGDGNDFSKKPASERYSELFACISKPLFTFMAANMDCLLRESVETSNLVLDSLEAPGPRELFVRSVDAEDRSACYSALAELASREFVPCDVGQEHLIEHKQGSFVLGRLLRCDDAFPEDLRLSSHLAALDSEQIGSWVGCNKGCFILLRLMEKGSESTREKVASSVSIRRLESYTTKGAELLLAALRQR